MKTLVVVVLVVAALCSTSFATWNLSNDFSDLSNPNGPWSYNGASGADTAILYETHMSDYSPGDFASDQPSWRWGGGPGHLGIAKMIYNGNQDVPGVGWTAKGWDYLAGDVLGHGSYHIRWTAPADMTITVEVEAWRIRAAGPVSVYLFEKDGWTNSQPDKWAGMTILSGTHTRSSPGIITRTFAVVAGQNVDFFAEGGDYIAMDVTILPEPMTVGLLGLGSLLALRRRRA